MVRWVKAGGDPAGVEDQRKELVATLDQINAYMLLVTPVLPSALKAEWKSDLHMLAYVVINKFWSEADNMFLGTIPCNKDKNCEPSFNLRSFSSNLHSFLLPQHTPCFLLALRFLTSHHLAS